MEEITPKHIHEVKVSTDIYSQTKEILDRTNLALGRKMVVGPLLPYRVGVGQDVTQENKSYDTIITCMIVAGFAGALLPFLFYRRKF